MSPALGPAKDFQFFGPKVPEIHSPRLLRVGRAVGVRGRALGERDREEREPGLSPRSSDAGRLRLSPRQRRGPSSLGP